MREEKREREREKKRTVAAPQNPPPSPNPKGNARLENSFVFSFALPKQKAGSLSLPCLELFCFRQVFVFQMPTLSGNKLSLKSRYR